MRRWIAAGATVAGLLLFATPAQAGTYEVVSCGAPGAGGVNRAWTGDIAPAGQPYQIANCGSQLLGATSSTRQQAAFFSGANWSFTAPAGTTISRLVTWRFGQVFCCNGWVVHAYEANGNTLGGGFLGETCRPPEGFVPCTFGAAGGVSNASRAEYGELSTTRITYSVACGELSGCYTANESGQRFAEYHVYGTAVTIRDDQAPSLSVGGPLLAGGWLRPGAHELTYQASDATGIRRVIVNGAASDRPCDYRRPAPCSAASGRQAILLPEGVHQFTVTAEDASGNPTSQTRTVSIDGTPPTARIAAVRRRSILVDVTDNVSGVASGQVLVRRNSRRPFRALPTTLEGGRLRARGRVRGRDVRVIVDDVSGLRREGLGTKLRITSARAGRRKLRIRRGRVIAPNGRAVRLRGRLSLLRGRSVPGAEVIATTSISRGGAPQVPLARVITNRKGRFRLRLPAGPSRVVHLSSPGAGEALGAVGRLPVQVPAASSIRASRRALSGPGRVRFSGRVKRRGQSLPPRGLVIILQAREDGRWRTFEDARTDARGRWSQSYRFRGNPGTYPIRARIRRQAGFPFVLGHSRTVRVHVR